MGNKLIRFLPKKNIPVLNLPVKIPMIIPPKKYLEITNNKLEIKLGGFLLNDEFYIEPLIIDNLFLVNKTEFCEENIIYKMVDNLNSVSFNINQEVLDFITKYYKKYNLIIDPDFIHPLEEKNKLTKLERITLDSFLSRRNLESDILNLAHILRNISFLKYIYL